MKILKKKTLWIIVVLLLGSGGILFFSLEKFFLQQKNNEPSAVLLKRPKLRTAGADQNFTPEEETLIRLITDVYTGLAHVFERVTEPTSAEAVPHLKSFMDPMLTKVSPWTSRYHALPHDRKLALHKEVFQRNEKIFQNFVQAGMVWTEMFRSKEHLVEYRKVYEEVLFPWAKADALLVFAGFGEEAVKELREIALRETGEREPR